MSESAPPTQTALEPAPWVITPELMERFAELFGDVNPLHTDAEFGRASAYRDNIVYGALSLLSLSALNWRGTLPRRMGFRRLTANFRQPVFVGDRLEVAPALFPPGTGDGPVEFEYEIRNRATGVVVTTGGGLLGLPGSEPEDLDGATEEPPLQPTRMPVQRLVEQKLAFGEIRTGQVSAFDFDVTAGALRSLHEILQHGAQSHAPGWREWLNNCDPRAFLLAPLFGTFIGMCIPGRAGVATNLHAEFHRPPALGRRCRMTGTVAFKSATTSTVQIDVVIGEASGDTVYATGKVQALVHALHDGEAPGP